jgi:hypothetical protein
MFAAPRLRAFFRPEEQDVRSGEDQIVVPLAKGQGEGDDTATVNVTIHDTALRRGAAVGVDSLDPRVGVKRSRDAEHVPRAVGVIGMRSDVDPEWRRMRGEWMRHAHVERSWLQEERMTAMQTRVCLTRLLDGDSQRNAGLVKRWKALALDKKLIDEKPHRPVALVVLGRYGFVHFGTPSGAASDLVNDACVLDRCALYATEAVILPRR